MLRFWLLFVLCVLHAELGRPLAGTWPGGGAPTSRFINMLAVKRKEAQILRLLAVLGGGKQLHGMAAELWPAIYEVTF